MNQRQRTNTRLINVLGNSTAMSIETLNLKYRDTYSYKINQSLGSDHVVINRARRNLTVKEQLEEVNVHDDISSIDADYHILQFGMGEGLPRLFTLKQRRFVAVVPGRKFLIRFMSKHRYFFTKRFPKVYEQKDQFRVSFHSLIETIFDKTRSKKIFVINIPQTTQKTKRRFFGIEKNIDDYNEIIKDVSRNFKDMIFFIDLYERTKADSELLCDDGLHITKKGHQMLADIICEAIRTEESQ